MTHSTSFAQRAATRAGQLLTPAPDRGRRSFLRRAALVGTALAVNPFDFILRPQSAYASVCGPANECSQGWTAFCCTINGGANTCPDGSYVAGWWKVSSSAFCRGEDRYVIDCNREPDATCSCRCATGECDRRRVCCNNFRYGQCNQQVRGTTEVVCRIVICTPPWEWDDSCTTTVRTDERTRDHSASCLNGTNPTEIEVVYQDLGLVGSALGAPTSSEIDTADGGSWRTYDSGTISRSTTFGVAVLVGPAGLTYARLGGPDGVLGHVTGDPVDVAEGQVLPTQNGALYTTPLGDAHALTGPIDAEYSRRGGPAGWLGFPVTGMLDAPGGRQRVDFMAGWSLAHDPSTGEVRLLPDDVELADRPGVWPATAGVARWDGPTRVQTAVRVSTESLPDGATTAVLAASETFADALAGGVLAATRRAPVLLTSNGGLPTETAAELQRLGVSTVVLIGGPSAIPETVEAQVRDAVPDAQVSRLAGADRFATAAAVSAAITGPDEGAPTVYLVNGRAFPDALSASQAAGRGGAPLLLTETDLLPEATREELVRLAPQDVVVVGGTIAVSDAVAEEVRELTGAAVRRLLGPSRYDTAAAVVEEERPDGADAVLVATGEAFADAMTAGAASATVGAPLLLTATGSLPAVTRRAIERLQPGLVVIVGGTAAVTDAVAQQLAAVPVEDHQPRG